MSEYEHLLYDVDEFNICWLTLNRPKCLNAVNAKLATELHEGLQRADRDNNVNVIVIRGAGRGFCSGHDLVEDAEDEFDGFYDYRAFYYRQQEEFTAPWKISKPVIASVHYCAIGKGFELALCCDVTIVTEETRLGYNEMRYGIAAMNFILPWLVNMKTAKDLILTGREVTAAEAKTMGLITDVVAADKLEEATLKKAKLMASMPNDMQRMHKVYLNRIYEMQGLKTATDYYQDLMSVMSVCPVPEYEEFSKVTNEKGLKAALEFGNRPYKDLD